jgi:hypothetical protein
MINPIISRYFSYPASSAACPAIRIALGTLGAIALLLASLASN